jgi:solute carrier family 44 (choline transporter-like protein), member 2/4/5
MKKQEVDHNTLREGPLKERRCTDILCCLIFFAFLGAMGFLGYYGYQHGDPEAVIYPYDSAGNQCGRPGTNTSDYEYVYFIDPTFTSHTKWKVCVKECPQSSSYIVNCSTTKWVSDCSFTVNGTHYAPYASTGYFHRLCMPIQATESFKEYIGGRDMMSFGSDVIRCKYIVLGVMGIAIGVSIIYLLFLRYFIGVVVWIVIAALIILLTLFGGYYNYQIYDEKNPITDEKTKYEYWAIAIGCYTVAFLFLVIMICLRKRIELAVAVMKSATIFIDDVWSVLFVPIAIFLISVVVYAFWVVALIYLYSSGTLVKDETADVIAKFQHDQKLQNALWFEFLGIVWINSFKVAMLQFIISFACCVWYFTEDKENLEHPIWRGVKNGIFYHMGSLAFGSFILSLVILIKWFLVILTRMHSAETQNPVVSCLCKCVFCCVECFERFIKFLDHQAYIRIAMTGESFCSAAQSAFEMIWENAGRFTALGGVGTVFNFLGKALITCLSAYLGFFIITTDPSTKDEIASPIGPTVVFVIVSYVVACLFMGVYEIAADTIIQAYILDEKIHGQNCPVFAPEPIKEFMSEHSKDN